MSSSSREYIQLGESAQDVCSYLNVRGYKVSENALYAAVHKPVACAEKLCQEPGIRSLEEADEDDCLDYDPWQFFDNKKFRRTTAKMAEVGKCRLMGLVDLAAEGDERARKTLNEYARSAQELTEKLCTTEERFDSSPGRAILVQRQEGPRRPKRRASIVRRQAYAECSDCGFRLLKPLYRVCSSGSAYCPQCDGTRRFFRVGTDFSSKPVRFAAHSRE